MYTVLMRLMALQVAGCEEVVIENSVVSLTVGRVDSLGVYFSSLKGLN